jgi:hypothetical protein
MALVAIGARAKGCMHFLKSGEQLIEGDDDDAGHRASQQFE